MITIKENSMILEFKKLTKTAKIPQYATKFAPGMDIFADIDYPVIISPGEIVTIGTGVAMRMVRQFGENSGNHFATFLFGCAGMHGHCGIHPANGVDVLDSDYYSDYREELCVHLCNVSQHAHTVKPGERIAQLVIMPVSHHPVIEDD